MKLKIVGIILGVLALLAVSGWAWKMLEWKRNASATIAETQRIAASAQAQLEATKDKLNEATHTIVELKKRKPSERVVLKNVPADCQACFTAHKIALEDGNSLWTYRNPDVIGQKGTLEADKLIATVINPYKVAEKSCQENLKKCLGTNKPKLFTLDYQTDLEVGMGTSPRAELQFAPVALGTKWFQVRPFVAAEVEAKDVLNAWAGGGLLVRVGK